MNDVAFPLSGAVGVATVDGTMVRGFKWAAQNSLVNQGVRIAQLVERWTCDH